MSAGLPAELTPAQRAALLARRQVRPSTQASGAPAGQAPLSFTQQRLWFIDRLQGPDPTYNMAFGVVLTGPLDPTALAEAVRLLMVRHDALRIRIEERVEGPIQVASSLPLDKKDVPLRILNFSALGPAAVERAASVSVEEAREPFDLSRGPLFRLTLLRLADDLHHLLITLHHIVGDGWSTELMLRDLLALYRQARSGHPAVLPALKTGYLDFARHQRHPARALEIERQVTAWGERLAGAPQDLDLMPAIPSLLRSSTEGAVHAFTLDGAVVESLRQACWAHGASLFMGLLAIFAALLNRHGAGEDLVIGTPIANRTRPELEPVMGFFANTLALRVDLSGDPSFAELLARARQIVLEAHDNGEAPFEQVVDRVARHRDVDRTPLFEAMLVLQPVSKGENVLAEGLAIRLFERNTGRVHFPLLLSFTETARGLEARLGYQSARFEEATIHRLARHFVRLAEVLAALPDRPLSTLPWRDEAEQEELYQLGRGPEVAVPWAGNLADFVDQQARHRPDSIAVEALEGELSYAELVRSANQLAHRLCALGLKAGEPVGLCLERGLSLPVALLAILKAGGAVMPLDPALPPARLAILVAEATPTLVVTYRRFCALLPAKIPVLLLDEESAEGGPEKMPLVPPASDAAAYVLFTSGSTGCPKAVIMGSSAFGNLIDWHRHHPALGQPARTAQFAAQGFDVAFQEIFATWATGGTLVTLDEEIRRDPRALWAFLEERRIERLYLPFVALQHLAEAAALEPWRQVPLTDLITAGEALVMTPAIADLCRRLKSCRLHNHYGPTETHVVTAETLEGAPTDWPERPAIGRPIPGIRLRIMGRDGTPVPLGVAGELWIGGAALARGYLGRPDLTAQRFVTTADEERFYRSGDRVRQRSDGRLDFLGRLDDQVKINGFRVEPGEIQAMLAAHPQVRDAAVLVTEAADGAKALAAYVAGRQEPLDVASLRTYLAERLPAYMVPAAIIVLEQLPVGPNGKLDRRALPKTVSDVAPRGDLPQGPMAQALAGIWQTLLGAEALSAESDFFTLGGHSLLAARLAMRVRESLGLDLPLRMVFETPRFGDLARYLETLGPESTALPPLVSADRSRPLPLSFAQERLYFLDQMNRFSTDYNMPTALRLCGPLDLAALERAFTFLVQRHEILRTRFLLENGRPVQVVDPPTKVAMPLMALDGLDPALRSREIARLLSELLETHFDLAAGPLLRLQLLCLGAEEHLLVVMFHHIVLDSWSIGPLLREIEAFYSGQAEEALPRPRVQYGDYALWQRSWIERVAAGPQAAYWCRQLAGLSHESPLPVSRPGSGARAGAEMVPLQLESDLAARLRALAKAHQATPFMVLLAGFAAFLFRLGGSGDIVIGAPLANRLVPEIESAIGFFVNMAALRLSLDSGTTMATLLTRARSVVIEAIAHQDLPFERVVELVNPRREGSGTPLVRVVFAFEEDQPQSFSLPGLAIEPWPLNARAAKFDFVLNLNAHGPGYIGGMEFDGALFDRETVLAFAEGFVALLETATREPDRPLVDLVLSGEGAQAVPPPMERAEDFVFDEKEWP